MSEKLHLTAPEKPLNLYPGEPENLKTPEKVQELVVKPIDYGFDKELEAVSSELEEGVKSLEKEEETSKEIGDKKRFEEYLEDFKQTIERRQEQDRVPDEKLDALATDELCSAIRFYCSDATIISDVPSLIADHLDDFYKAGFNVDAQEIASELLHRYKSGFHNDGYHAPDGTVLAPLLVRNLESFISHGAEIDVKSLARLIPSNSDGSEHMLNYDTLREYGSDVPLETYVRRVAIKNPHKLFENLEFLEKHEISAGEVVNFVLNARTKEIGLDVLAENYGLLRTYGYTITDPHLATEIRKRLEEKAEHLKRQERNPKELTESDLKPPLWSFREQLLDEIEERGEGANVTGLVENLQIATTDRATTNLNTLLLYDRLKERGADLNFPDLVRNLYFDDVVRKLDYILAHGMTINELMHFFESEKDKKERQNFLAKNYDVLTSHGAIIRDPRVRLKVRSINRKNGKKTIKLAS